MTTYCPVLGCTTIYHENSSSFCPFPKDSTRFGNLSKVICKNPPPSSSHTHFLVGLVHIHSSQWLQVHNNALLRAPLHIRSFSRHSRHKNPPSRLGPNNLLLAERRKVHFDLRPTHTSICRHTSRQSQARR